MHAWCLPGLWHRLLCHSLSPLDSSCWHRGSCPPAQLWADWPLQHGKRKAQRQQNGDNATSETEWSLPRALMCLIFEACLQLQEHNQFMKSQGVHACTVVQAVAQMISSSDLGSFSRCCSS